MPLNDYEADATELLETYDFLMKYIIIGEAGTGKSCLLHHFTHNSFKDHSQHTIGVEFSSRTVKLGEKRIKLQLWDTAGQERFRSVTRSYYRGAAGAILVYDITNRDSFTNLSRWLADARALGSPHLVTVLVGNKSDREEEREVEWAEASRWAAENDVHFLEASSLTGDNVEAPFMLAARSILLSIESGALDPEKAGSGVSYATGFTSPSISLPSTIISNHSSTALSSLPGRTDVNSTSFASSASTASVLRISSSQLAFVSTTSLSFVSTGSPTPVPSSFDPSTLASPSVSQTPVANSSTLESSPNAPASTMATRGANDVPADVPSSITSSSESSAISGPTSQTVSEAPPTSRVSLPTSGAPTSPPPSTTPTATGRQENGTGTTAVPPTTQQGNESQGRAMSTSTSIVFVKGTSPSTTMTNTITVEPESTFSTPVGIVVTQPDGSTTLSFPALVTVLSTSQEPDGSFTTFTHTIANPTGFSDSNSGAVHNRQVSHGYTMHNLAKFGPLQYTEERRSGGRDLPVRWHCAYFIGCWIEDMQRRPPAPLDSPDNPFMDRSEPPMMSTADPRDRVATRSPDRFYLDDGGPLIPLNANASDVSRVPPANTHHYKAPDGGPFSDTYAYQHIREIGRAVTTLDDSNQLRSPSPLVLSRQSTPSLYPPTVQDDLYEDVDLQGSAPVQPPAIHEGDEGKNNKPAPTPIVVESAPPRPPRSILRIPSKVYSPYAPMTPPDSVDGSYYSDSKPPSPEASRTGSESGHRNSLLAAKGSGFDDIFTRPTLLNVRPRSRDSESTK
uniref:Ras-domain-containing protein n=1 Tax=Moniliophthora roreri TaxID=221103 RepID=A0A0W0F5N3_MONRR